MDLNGPVWAYSNIFYFFFSRVMPECLNACICHTQMQPWVVIPCFLGHASTRRVASNRNIVSLFPCIPMYCSVLRTMSPSRICCKFIINNINTAFAMMAEGPVPGIHCMLLGQRRGPRAMGNKPSFAVIATANKVGGMIS